MADKEWGRRLTGTPAADTPVERPKLRDELKARYFDFLRSTSSGDRQRITEALLIYVNTLGRFCEYSANIENRPGYRALTRAASECKRRHEIENLIAERIGDVSFSDAMTPELKARVRKLADKWLT